MKIFYLIILLIVTSAIFASCSFPIKKSEIIRIKGSDSMLPLTERLASEYMKLNPHVSIYVEGGGTATGVKSLTNGETDICSASRTLRSDEIKELAIISGSVGMSYLIAKDAISIYINPRNKVRNFTMTELSDIFQCKKTNWKDFGADDIPIEVIIRPANSGTYLYFKEHVLIGEPYCPSSIVKNTTESIIEVVRKNAGAVGYGSLSKYEGIIHSKINNIEATEENVRNDIYPLSRYLYFYSLNIPKGAAKKFIDWTLSNQGQRVIKETGYIPLWNIVY